MVIAPFNLKRPQCYADEKQSKSKPMNPILILNRFQIDGSLWCRVQVTRFFVRLYLSDQQNLTLFRDGRVVVNGTDQISEAA